MTATRHPGKASRKEGLRDALRPFQHVGEQASATLARQIAGLVEPYLGRRLLGVTDAVGGIEFVFDGPRFSNLLTIELDDNGGILGYAHGVITEPEAYAGATRVLGSINFTPGIDRLRSFPDDKHLR